MRTGRWRDGAMMVALVVLGGGLALRFGEHIGINEGQGWDGLAYTQWARDTWHAVGEGLTRYHAQRVLPSAIVDGVLRAATVTHDIPHVVRAFAMLDVAALAVAAALWANLAAVMAWSRAAAWAGFVALFLSFANAKHAIYYPTLTDPSAFALGMAMVWAYLTGRPFALWLSAALGMVTWPALPPLAVILLVFPRPTHAPIALPASRLERRLAISASIAAAGGFVAVALYYLLHPLPGVGDEKFAAWVPRGLLWLTLPALVAVIAGGLYRVLSPVRLPAIAAYGRGLARRRLAVAALAVVVLHLAGECYLSCVGTRGSGPTGAQFACEHTLAALRGPLWGLVHHVVYFGPIIALALVMWRRVSEVAWSWGPAAVIALAMVVMFAAGSNSRQWNHLVPFLVAATIAATAPWWTLHRVLGFAAVAFVWSKVWFHLGYDTALDWHAFPNQRYFMNTGPYAADAPYAVHLAAAALTIAAAWLATRRLRTSQS